MSAEGPVDFGALLPGVGVFGGVRRFLALGNALVQRGHRFVLYHPDGSAPDWLPFHGEVRPLAALAAAEHHVLLCGEPSLLADFETARARLKLFYVVLEKLPGERRIVRHPGWVILANSSGIRARLARRYGVRAEEAIGGLDAQIFHPAATARPPHPSPLRVMIYGRLSRGRKGTQLAIQAAERVDRRLRRRRDRDPLRPSSIELVLFDHLGPGNERDPRSELRTTLQHEFPLNLSQAELAALYASADVFISAEKRAGWNNTVAEAMACGVPVVCTPSGTRDLAHHLRTAWVTRWRHPWALARGLEALATQPALRMSLRGAALAQVREFTWERLAARLEAIARAHL
jgi:glycosyltransferase involved in cell wall biosynthesis